MYKTFPAIRKLFLSLVAWDLEYPPSPALRVLSSCPFSLSKQTKRAVCMCELTSLTAVVATASEFYRIDDPTLSHRSVYGSLPPDFGGSSL